MLLAIQPKNERSEKMKRIKRIRKIRVNARISEVDYAQLVKIAKRKGLTVSEAIREGVKFFLLYK